MSSSFFSLFSRFGNPSNSLFTLASTNPSSPGKTLFAGKAGALCNGCGGGNPCNQPGQVLCPGNPPFCSFGYCPP